MASASSLRRFIWLTLLLAVLSGRGLTPDGWMTTKTADGGVALMPCDGMGGMTMTASSDRPTTMMGHAMVGHHGTGHDKPDHGNRADRPCAFAGIANVDTAPPPVAFAAPIQLASDQPILAVFGILPGRGLAAPPPPATGPPALA